jgi:hypothetical protein
LTEPNSTQPLSGDDAKPLEKNESASGTLLVKIAQLIGIEPSNQLLPYVVVDVDKNEVIVKATSMDSQSYFFQNRAVL